MLNHLLAVGIILAVMFGWISIQGLARRVTARHPEYGPHRECMGCGLACICESQQSKQEQSE